MKTRVEIAVVFPDEALDATSAPRLAALVREELEFGRSVVSIDCAAVRFADSVGLGLLVRLNRKYAGRVQLHAVPNSLRLCFGRVAAGMLPTVVEAAPPVVSAESVFQLLAFSPEQAAS